MDHDFYSVHEAAKQLDCGEDDLLKWGAAGKIELNIWYAGMDYWSFNVPCPLSEVKDFIVISKEDSMHAYEKNKVDPKARAHQLTLKYKNRPLMTPGPFSLDTDNLYISKETFETLKDELLKKSTKSVSPSLKEDEKSQKSNLHIIGALVKIILDGGKFKSEAEIRRHIDKKYKGYLGCSERTLSERFKRAKDLLSE